MKKALDLSEKVIGYILTVLLAVFTVVTIMQVFYRFVLRLALPWGDEVVRGAFVWAIFLGSATAVRNGTHLCMDLLTDKLQAGMAKVARIVVLAIIFATSALFMYASYDFVLRSTILSHVVLTWLPMNAVKIAMPISAVLMMIYAVELIVRELRGKAGPSDEPGDELSVEGENKS